MSWFNVPGQGCPISLGNYPCETALDCTNYLNQLSNTYPQCRSLQGSNFSPNYGAITGMTCNPFTRTCQMQENYNNIRDDWKNCVF